MQDAFGVPASVLVVGGTSDIGVAIAADLVRQGCATVGLACRNPSGEAASTASTNLELLGASVSTIHFDASSAEPGWAADEISANDWDCVVVAFGELGDQTELLADLDAAASLMHVNYAAAATVCLSAAEGLRKRGQGSLIVLSSVAAIRARSANFLYASTKAGLDSVATGLGDMLAGTGVNVITVRPGFVRSKMTDGLADQPFATTPEAVAADVVKAIQQRRTQIVWSPKVLRGLYLVLRSIPSVIWRKMSA